VEHMDQAMSAKEWYYQYYAKYPAA
jgi:hypothetical protein